MEENTQYVQLIMLIISRKVKNATEMQKKIYAVYGEGAVIEHAKSGS